MVNAETIADRFRALVRESLTADQCREVDRRNKTAEYRNACSTHDFVDANEIMGNAFEELGLDASDPSDESTTNLWNAAWNIAVKRGFGV